MHITVVRPGYKVIKNVGTTTAKFLELCGRVCYGCEDRITDASAETFVRMLRKSGDESVLEHACATVQIIGSRSMSHQLVRHRIGTSFSQESQRYCNYGRLGFQVICPPKIGLPPDTYYYDLQWPSIFWLDAELTAAVNINVLQHHWLQKRVQEYQEYISYVEDGIPPEDARECLPNATKTEIVTTCNLRQWRHIFAERALNPKAQWQIRGIMQGILREFASRLPCVFEDQLEQLKWRAAAC